MEMHGDNTNEDYGMEMEREEEGEGGENEYEEEWKCPSSLALGVLNLCRKLFPLS